MREKQFQEIGCESESGVQKEPVGAAKLPLTALLAWNGAGPLSPSVNNGEV